MSRPFIRELNISYRDPIEKRIKNQTLPRKFLEEETDDYKPKRNINVRPSRPQKYEHHHRNPESCLSKFCCCINFNLDLCSDCRSHLCKDCKKSSTLRFSICKKCKQNLCPSCKRAAEGKTIKLRNYRIKLKNMKELHFEDCNCSECNKE